ncbi:MAG: AI-2E family transporter [Rhodothermales bacterium]
MSSQNTTHWTRVFVLVALGVGALVFISYVADLVKLVIVAVLFAYLLDPIATRLESRGMSRTWATVSIFAGLSLLFTGIFLLFFPGLLRQLEALQAGLVFQQAEAALGTLEELIVDKLGFLGIEQLNLSESLRRSIDQYEARAFTYLPGMLSILGNLVIIPFMMFFFLRDARSMKKGLINMVPNKYFEFSLNVLQKMDDQLGNYLRGQFLIAAIVGVLSTFALWVLGVDFFLVIGPIAGLANMIPYIGPLFGGILAVVVSVFTTGTFDTIPAIAISFLTIQGIDNVFLQPLILARNVQLHPLLLLIALLLGGKYLDIVGLILAVPLAAIIKVVLQETVVNLRRYHFN